MAQGKINQNMNILLACEQLAAQQASALVSVITQIRADHAALEQKCASIRGLLGAEKSRVFQLVRAKKKMFGKITSTYLKTNTRCGNQIRQSINYRRPVQAHPLQEAPIQATAF